MRLRGSSLVFSLVVLSFLLMSAVSLAVVSVTNRRSALASKNSTLAFQVADTGAEEILYQIYKVNDSVTSGPLADLDALASKISTATCASGVLTKGTQYEAMFYECTDASSCSSIACGDNSWRDNITKMKIFGKTGGVTRAIEVGIAPKQP